MSNVDIIDVTYDDIIDIHNIEKLSNVKIQIAYDKENKRHVPISRAKRKKKYYYCMIITSKYHCLVAPREGKIYCSGSSSSDSIMVSSLLNCAIIRSSCAEKSIYRNL